MQSINLQSRINDLEAIRQILKLDHGQVVAGQSGFIVQEVSKIQALKLINAGFNVNKLGAKYLVN